MAGKQLHILTSTELQSQWSHALLAQWAFEGGADVVQVREKQNPGSIGEMHLRKTSRQKLILNDHVSLAVKFNFEGAHVGAADLSPVAARQALGNDRVLGVTIHNLIELAALQSSNARPDYIGVGPVFGTQSKEMTLGPLGLEGLAEICRISSWPVIAIGSVTLQNVARVMEAGAAGVAVLSAFCLADDPLNVARRFKEILG